MPAPSDPDFKCSSSDEDPTLAQDGSGCSGKPAGNSLPNITKPLSKQGTISEKPGDTIGRYKLLQQIGEGGFGVVYMAEQRKPIKRKVALKIIKPGMDTKEVIARFEAERQALALMDHPCIAKVLDVGATETGRPYFAMELVKGVSVTEYCDGHRLDTRQRLQLFQDICGAVQHAHQKGVIHRDLKPNNILVSLRDTKPSVKIIDFGIAKAISQELTENTLFTAFGQMIGTPQYMSPEQSEMGGLDVDTRSDIYSLGVVLYELLTGRTPIDPKQLRQAGLDEIHRLIREEEPPKPSTRLTSLKKDEITAVAKAHNEGPEKLSRLVSGDLDWIVMKALDKDRSRRYETATGFAEDIRRYLDDEAVLASPPSSSYRLRKFVKRNKAPIATGGVVLGTLIAAVVVSTWQATEANKAREAEAGQRKLAEENANKAQSREAETKAVLTFFQDEVLAAARPKDQAGGLGIDVTIKEAIDAVEPKIAEAFADQPLVEASIRSNLQETYNYLGDDEAELVQLERKLELLRKALGNEHPDTLDLMRHLASSYGLAGRVDERLALREECLELHRKILEERRGVLGEEHPETLDAMEALAGSFYREADDRGNEELALREELLKLRRKALGAEHPDTLRSMRSLAMSYRSKGRGEDALSLRKETLNLHRKILEQHSKKLGEEHPDTLDAMHELVNSYYAAGRHNEAIALGENVVKLRSKVLGEEHPDTLDSMQDLAWSYRRADRDDEALALGEELLDLRRKVDGTEHPDTLSSMQGLARSYHDAGRHDEALTLRERTMELRRKVLGGEHPDTLISMQDLGDSYHETDFHDEGVSLHEEALSLHRKVFGAEHPDTISAMQKLASSYSDASRPEDEVSMNEEVLRLMSKVFGNEYWDTFNAMEALANSYHWASRYDEEIALRKEILERHREKHGDKHPDTLYSMQDLASTYSNLMRYAEEYAVKKEILKWHRKVLGNEHSDTLSSIKRLAYTCASIGRYDEALALRKESLALHIKIFGGGNTDTFNSMHQLAGAYDRTGRHDEAILMGKETLESRRKLLGDKREDTKQSLDRLVYSYHNAGRHNEAITLRKEGLELGYSGPRDRRSPLQELLQSFRAAGQYDEEIKVMFEILEQRRRQHGPEHPNTLDSMHELGDSYRVAGRRDEEISLREKTLKLRNETLGPGHQSTLNSMQELAKTYWDVDRHAEALSMREETLELRRKLLGTDHKKTIESMHDLSKSYHQAGRHEEAISLRVALLKLKHNDPFEPDPFGPQEPHWSLKAMLANSYDLVGRQEEALALREEAQEGPRKQFALYRKVYGVEHPYAFLAAGESRNYSYLIGRPDDILSISRETLHLLRKLLGDEHPDTLSAMSEHAHECIWSRQFEDAELLLREWISLREKQAADDMIFHFHQSTLGSILVAQKRHSEAEPMLLAGYQGVVSSTPKPESRWPRICIHHLINLYTYWNEAEKVTSWKTKLAELNAATDNPK